jgi:3'-phosphoadenosine 5'-phosphosulfate sulfotransferase (PAPS reductase)/FAD synthetase
MTQHIVSLSGGKDSTAMFLKMLELGMPVDRVIFIDTTKEFPEMYEHIQKLQEYVYPINIEIVKLDYDYWFAEHVKTKGKRKGTKGYGWPDFRNRWCTALKSEAFKRTVYGDGTYNPRERGRIKKLHTDIIEYHGIALDEMERTKKNHDGRVIKYPLIDLGMTEADALQYCYGLGFNWGGLYEKFHRVSCWCCPLKRMGELECLYKHFPHLWQQLKEMDKCSFRDFKANYTVGELERRFSQLPS